MEKLIICRITIFYLFAHYRLTLLPLDRANKDLAHKTSPFFLAANSRISGLRFSYYREYSNYKLSFSLYLKNFGVSPELKTLTKKK